MTNIMENNILDKVNDSFKGVNDKLSDLKTTIIDDKLEQLQVSSTLPKIIEKLNNLLHINFLGLGTTGSLLGISVFDMQKKLSTNKT